MSPYPLIFTPILMEKVWGGRRLERYGKHLPPGRPIGESWEIADLAATSPSGGGGNAARSVIASGPLRGRTLADAISLWSSDLDSRAAGGFPLLVKYLDARENLSVQVHPSPAYAQAHPGAHVKFEAWYIVEAQPGAVIYAGLRDGVTRGVFLEHAQRGTLEKILSAVPAVPGDCHVLPSGTCHALGAGVLVAEVQTPSDTTFRVWDWGRSGREMHLPQAIECLTLGPCPAVQSGDVLASTDHFSIRRGRGESLASSDAEASHGQCAVVMMVRGTGRLEWNDGSMILRSGDTVLVPAAVVNETFIDARSDAEWLVVRSSQ